MPFIGFYAGFYYHEKITPAVPQNIIQKPSTTNLTPVESTVIPKEITTGPRSGLIANHYFKVNVTGGNDKLCGTPPGIVRYSIDSFGGTQPKSFMKVNSLILPGSPESKKGLNDIVAFLDQNNLKPLQNILPFEQAFHDYCGGASYIYIKEIPTNGYRGTDKSRAIIVYTTQAMFGQVTVVVFAKKGTDVIQLSELLDASYIYTADAKSCGMSDNPNQAFGAEYKCYQNKLIEDKTIESYAINEANILIDTFTLEGQ